MTIFSLLYHLIFLILFFVLCQSGHFDIYHHVFRCFIYVLWLSEYWFFFWFRKFPVQWCIFLWFIQIHVVLGCFRRAFSCPSVCTLTT